MFHVSGYHCPFLRLHVDLWILGTCFCVQAATLTELLGIQYSISVSSNLCWTHLLEKECSLYSEIKWALWSREEEILPHQSSSLEIWKKKKKAVLNFFWRYPGISLRLLSESTASSFLHHCNLHCFPFSSDSSILDPAFLETVATTFSSCCLGMLFTLPHKASLNVQTQNKE